MIGLAFYHYRQIWLSSMLHRSGDLEKVDLPSTVRAEFALRIETISESNGSMDG